MSDKFRFIIGGQTIEIEDLGQTLNSQFMALHVAHLAKVAFDFNEFKKDSSGFFDGNPDDFAAHDKFFNNFSVVWRQYLAQRRYSEASSIWQLALEIAYEWENQNPNKRIHKGTPYYFLGATHLLNDEMGRGFLLMHQALEEDKKTHNVSAPSTPAHAFVTLDHEKQDQFFRAKLVEIAKFANELLAKYSAERGGALSLEEFRFKFLEDTGLPETVFYFIFTVFRLEKLLRGTDSRLMESVFASLLETNTIFDLCVIIDEAIKSKNTTADNQSFYDQARFLSAQAKLSLDGNKLGKINQDFQADFPKTLGELLSSNYAYEDGTTPLPIEADLAIAYGFRNFGAHKIEDQPVVYQNFADIVQRILNTLFFAVEELF
jgi:hypothetical protein